MKARHYGLIVAAALALPVVAHAQETGSTVTRAQVRAELVQLEKAGYQPARNDRYYPADIQAAEAKVHAEDNNAAVGGATAGATQAGSRIDVSGASRTLFTHH
jgi:hypothetical protein